MRGYVLDTSVLYYGKDFPEGFECVVTPGVIRELDKEGMGERLELLLTSKIRVLSASKRSLDRVSKEAERTGDSERLSQTDKELLALSLDLGYELLSDDYSIQNIARVLGVPCRGMDQKGIQQVFEWEARCIGCGKVFQVETKVCDICGSRTKIRRRRRVQRE